MHLLYFFAFMSRLECLHGITFGWKPLREEMETGEGGRGWRPPSCKSLLR